MKGLFLCFILFQTVQSNEDELIEMILRLREDVESQFQTLTNRVNLLESKVQYKTDVLENRVAFSAYRGTVTSVEAYGQLIFDNTFTNYGSYYNTGTGEFICPVTGTYYFAASIGQIQTNNLALQICRDDQYLLAAYGDHDNWDQGAISIIIDCNAGSRVWLRQGRDESSEYGHSADGPLVNSFVGFLMYLSI